MPHANDHDLAPGIDLVTKDVSTCAESSEHLPATVAVVHRTANLRKLGELASGGLDADSGVACGNGILIREKIVETLDVIERFRKPDYRRHDVRWPLASSSSQFITCSLGIASAVA